MRHVDGAPMGTRGGISVVHTFPADGDYIVKVALHNEPLGGIYGRTTMATMDIKEQIEVSVNGERAALLDLNVRMSETDPKNGLDIKTPPIHIAAGPQRISAAFIQRFDGPVDDLLVPLENTLADVNITLRRHRAAAHARHDDPRAVRGDRRLRHVEPPHGLHLPADERERRRDLRRRDRQEPDRARLPRRTPTPDDVQDRDGVLREGAQEPATSRPASAWRCSRC